MTALSSILIGALVKKSLHTFVLMAMFPRHQNETSSVFLVAESEKRGRVCFKKGVGINYPTQETCRTSGYCSGLVSILVMYWQTLPLISLKPGVIKKQGPYWGPIGFWITFQSDWQVDNVKKKVHSSALRAHLCEFSNDIEHELKVKSCASQIPPYSFCSYCFD